MNDRLDPMLADDAPPAAAAPIARLHELFAAQRRAFAAEMNPSREARVDRLDRLLRLTDEHQHEIVAAISADFGHRSRHETDLAEIFLVVSALRHMRRHVGRWMRPRRVATPAHLLPARSEIIRQPLGVIGVISPWNYPFQLGMLPAAAALAAGNRVLLKPSELTPRFSALLEKIVAATFAADEFAVVPGDVEVGRAFATLAFDHLFFTGSTAVGRQVALAAAQNLTPVTLELGGKSPAIIDADCDFAEAAPRIAFAKLLNAGQTCVAPDYALVPRARVDAFVTALRGAVAKLYPASAGESRLHEHRQRSPLSAPRGARRGRGRTRCDGRSARRDQRARRRPLRANSSPTALIGATDAMAVMQEEIFGPILPVLPYDSLDEAIASINARPRPLALYWFGRSDAHRDRVLRGTISGGVTVNDACWHVAQENLPFGGVGASGIRRLSRRNGIPHVHEGEAGAAPGCVQRSHAVPAAVRAPVRRADRAAQTLLLKVRRHPSWLPCFPA